MHAVSVCVSNPLNYDMDYKISMIFSCMKCIHACSVCLYLFHKTEWLTFSLWVGGWGLGFGGLWPPFFIGGNPWAPFYEIGSTLEPWRHTLHDYLSNLSLRNSSWSVQFFGLNLEITVSKNNQLFDFCVFYNVLIGDLAEQSWYWHEKKKRKRV